MLSLQAVLFRYGEEIIASWVRHGALAPPQHYHGNRDGADDDNTVFVGTEESVGTDGDGIFKDELSVTSALPHVLDAVPDRCGIVPCDRMYAIL